MSSQAVLWHQGMFLRPHHFQAADRYWHDQLQQSSRWDITNNWGIHSIDINPDALKNFRFEVRHLQCRLRDGTLIRVPQDGILAPLEFRDALSRKNPLEIAVAVPLVQLGRSNLQTGEGMNVRYSAEIPREGIPDENTGQNPWQVQFRQMNMRLIAITKEDDATGYDVLPLAHVERSGKAEAVPELHEPYIPPLLHCDGWAPLQVDILQRIYHRVSNLVTNWGNRVKSKRITFDSQSPGDRQLFEGLRLLNEIFASLRIMAFAPGIHPLQSYTEFCRTLGKLAILGPNVRPPEDIPFYDHDNLGHCFLTVKKYIEELLGHVFDQGYFDVPFIGSGLRMKVNIKPEWMAQGFQMFVGVDCPLPAEQVIRLLRGGLNMKIGSQENVDDIFQRGLRGLAFTHNPKPPRVLPDSRTLTYFQIDRTASPDEWTAVQRTYCIAIRLNEKLIAGSIEGQSEVAIRTDGPIAKMQFTLYVVPMDSAKDSN